MKKIALASIRAQNLKQIFEVIVKEGPTTRGRLAEATRLSLMTVSNVVENMIANNVITVRSKKASPGAGRKADLVDVVQDAHALLVLDLTEREFAYQVLGLSGKQLYEAQPIATEPMDGYEASLRCYLEKVAEDLAAHGMAGKLVGVGVSAPGPYLVTEDTVYNGLIPELNSVKLKALISGIFGSEVMIYIDEDVKYAARANLSMVENAQDKTLAYIYIGEGVGGAFLANGKVLMGAHSMAGEISRVMIGPDGRRAQSLNRKEFLSKLGISGGSWTAEVTRIREQDPERVERALQQMAVDLAELCFTLVWLIDPHEIILECDYVRLLDENFAERVRGALRQRLDGMLPHEPEISTAFQGLRYAHRGAAMVLTDKWLEQLAAGRTAPSEQ